MQFSGAEIAVIAALLAAVTTPLGLMYKSLQAEKDRQIARLEAQNDALMHAVLSGTKAVENTTTVLKQRTTQR